VPRLVLLGVGIAFFMTPNNKVIMSSAPKKVKEFLFMMKMNTSINYTPWLVCHQQESETTWRLL
jgi:hypothetical protein